MLTGGAAACCPPHGTLIDIPSKWDSCIFASDRIVDGRSFRCCLLQLISDVLYTNFCLVVFCVEHKKVNVINDCRKTRIIAPWEPQTPKHRKYNNIRRWNFTSWLLSCTNYGVLTQLLIWRKLFWYVIAVNHKMKIIVFSFRNKVTFRLTTW